MAYTVRDEDPCLSSMHRFLANDGSLMFVIRVTDDTAETDILVPHEVHIL